MMELKYLKNLCIIYTPTYLSEIVIVDTDYIFQNNQRELSAISLYI